MYLFAMSACCTIVRFKNEMFGIKDGAVVDLNELVVEVNIFVDECKLAVSVWWFSVLIFRDSCWTDIRFLEFVQIIAETKIMSKHG